MVQGQNPGCDACEGWRRSPEGGGGTKAQVWEHLSIRELTAKHGGIWLKFISTQPFQRFVHFLHLSKTSSFLKEKRSKKKRVLVPSDPCWEFTQRSDTAVAQAPTDSREEDHQIPANEYGGWQRRRRLVLDS